MISMLYIGSNDVTMAIILWWWQLFYDNVNFFYNGGNYFIIMAIILWWWQSFYDGGNDEATDVCVTAVWAGAQ